MVHDGRVALLTLVAELGAEVDRIDRAVQACIDADRLLAEPDVHVVTMYGAAALLESFYTGVEKALRRVAAWSGSVPRGEAWHRDLLEASRLDIPGVRPAVLSLESAAQLERYLTFRHRFRNLYVFDLDVAQLRPLLAAVPETWRGVRGDLLGFARRLESWVQ